MGPTAPGEPALELDGVGFSYPRREVLKSVSFLVHPGTFCVLLGINGAGKTTLFSLITRLFLARSGRIRIFGNDLGQAARRALRELGVVFQQPTLDLDLSVRQNLRYHCSLHGLSQASVRQRIDRALADLGLSDRSEDRVRQLSGGQRRRVELARALLHGPRLLLADEPTVGLDIHSRQAILGQIRKTCRDQGVGVLWATHLVDELEPEDQMVVLHGGRVLADGKVRQVVSDTGAETVHEAFNSLTGGGRM